MTVNLISLLIFSTSFIAASHATLVQMAARNLLPGKPSPPGSPWPLPAQWSRSSTRAALGSQESFNYVTSVTNCSILNEALQRYNYALLTRGTKPNVASNLPVLSTVSVQIPLDDTENLCSQYPTLSTDPNYEAYEIFIGMNPTNEDTAMAVINAETIWGALRGLETFSQLVWRDQDWSVNQFYVNFTEITDQPRYPHRGLLVDTARHYLPPNVILQILDGMAYNKLNVFHWHIVDDQSWPYVSETFPELSAKGAFIPGYLEYNQTIVSYVIEEARLRGIRVLFEFDTPGHSYSILKSHPELLTPCFGDGVNPGTPNYPQHAAYENLDPTREATYEFIQKLFTEIITKTSKDEYIHLGMDEIYYPCWRSSPKIAEFMQQNNYTSIDQVQEHYTKRVLAMTKDIGGKAIIWQDPIEFGVDVDKDVIVQVWKNPFGGWPNPWQTYMQMVLDQGYKTLLSGCWYINHLKYGQPWREYYDCDPVKSLPKITEEQKKLILGGEAAIWGEYVDATNVVSRLFPVVGTTAEKLWSPMDASTTDDALWRLDEQRCRLIGRGINAQPIITSYCFAEESSFQYHPPSIDQLS